MQWVSLARLWACSRPYPPSPLDQLAPWFSTAARTGISEHSLGTSGAPQRSSEAVTDAPSTAGDIPRGNFYQHTCSKQTTILQHTSQAARLAFWARGVNANLNSPVKPSSCLLLLWIHVESLDSMKREPCKQEAAQTLCFKMIWRQSQLGIISTALILVMC